MSFWRGKAVFLTGHTGFKGGWLSLWLQEMGARVHGYALTPNTEPSFFDVARVGDGMAAHHLGNLLDADKLRQALVAAKPDVVLHLAAQPLVRYSYDAPIETYAVNVMGTANLLEAVRASDTVRAVVSVTTDKCYDNKEWVWGYREGDALGGRDPYSSSKACAELVTAAWRESFLRARNVAVASARAGNVIGGGDWAKDRLIPDFLRAHDAARVLDIRYPDATRPWQHVLEPLAGYLALAQALVEKPGMAAQAWNFGPADEGARSVRWILDHLAKALPGKGWAHPGVAQPHESGFLKLDSSKAKDLLGWKPRWILEKALDETVAWHQAWRAGDDMRRFSLAQIGAYGADA